MGKWWPTRCLLCWMSTQESISLGFMFLMFHSIDGDCIALYSALLFVWWLQLFAIYETLLVPLTMDTQKSYYLNLNSSFECPQFLVSRFLHTRITLGAFRGTIEFSEKIFFKPKWYQMGHPIKTQGQSNTCQNPQGFYFLSDIIPNHLFQFELFKIRN